MSDAITAEQFDFPLDDPRLESKEAGTMDQLKLWRRITKERGGLVSPKQVSVLAGVAPSTVSGKISRGHFTTYELFGLKCIPMDEVLLYLEQRQKDELAKGGHGLKAPSYWELLKAN